MSVKKILETVVFCFNFMVLLLAFSLAAFFILLRSPSQITQDRITQTTVQETNQEKKESPEKAKLISEDYVCQKIGGTNYLSLTIQESDDESPEIVIAGALTEIEKQYEINKIITINERTFLIEIIKEK